MKRYLTFTVVAGSLALGAASPVFAQTQGMIGVGVSANGVTQFTDERTGKVWTPENVSKDNQTPQQHAAMPATPALAAA